MLSRIDDIIYPNRCEVIELASQRYIYPIYKNGSGSITEYAKLSQYKTLFNEQIRRVELINVILRDPLSRFISGVNTYVFNTKRDNPNLDVSTILYFVEHYLFLNRHYSPQVGWILNLSKYTNDSTKIRLFGMDSLLEFTPLHSRPQEENILTVDDISRLQANQDLLPYIKLDNSLLELIGQELTVAELLKYIKDKNPNVLP